ncbi:hypothetical protein [Indioceanicola profundi]|uniref:hypothetical protein n=1 Tax=Indioceanicola profundi TaxID=2220096 RepID=UPI000E6AA422|nr:hypothetical protein [Indioceanicola profundi]
MRWFAIIALLAAFMISIPGFSHAVDVAHSHGQVSVDSDSDTDAPMGKKFVDCHHGCGHSHAANHVSPVRVSAPVTWISSHYPVDRTPAPESADPSPPYKPPRA